MDTKLKSTISKIQQERARGNHSKATKRAADALGKYPDSPELYCEAIDSSMEAAESLQAIQFIKRAFARLPGERPGLMSLARERASTLGDAVVGKFLLEDTIRRRELREARAIVGEFADRTARDLLQRTRMKRSTLASAAHGGHSVNDETMTNTVSEAILSARLGRPDDAAAATAQALEGSPHEAEALTALLEDMVEENPECASAHFVLSRCLSSISRHAEATDHLTKAVRLDPELGPEALDLLDAMSDGFDVMPDSIERTLLKVLLITRQFDRAAVVARPWLERSDDGGNTIVDAIAAHTRDSGAVNDLHVLLLDAALQANRMPALHETLHALAEQPDNGAAILKWFDSTADRVFTADIELLRAQLLIHDQRHQDAARALKALCVASREDIPRVSTLLKSHRDDHQALADLANEIAAPRETNDDTELEIASTAPASAVDNEPAASGDAFEVFETQEFHLSSGDAPVAPAFEVEDGPAVVEIGDGAPADDFNIYDGSDILGSGQDGPRPKAPIRSAYAGERRPLDNDTAGILWEEEGDDASGETPGAEIDATRVDEGYVRNVADGLYMSGAATFFHIDNEADNATNQTGPEPETKLEPKTELAPEPEPQAETKLEPVSDLELEPEAQPETERGLEPEAQPETEHGLEPEPHPETELALEPEQQPEPEPETEAEAQQDAVPEAEPDVQPENASAEEPLSYQERISRFLDGQLDDDGIVELMEEAAHDGRVEDLRQLIDFSPSTESHELRKGLCGAEYELMEGRPARALEHLKSVRNLDMSEEQRKDTWLKTVACQRMIQDFDAAHQTMLQLVTLYPDCPEVAKLAQQNYREYLQNQCADAPVLEKVTSLDGDI